ncbi:MAG: endolytic transglycosylase MltG [Polyangiales bacterium]
MKPERPEAAKPAPSERAPRAKATSQRATTKPKRAKGSKRPPPTTTRGASTWAVVVAGVALAFFFAWAAHWYVTPLRGRGRPVRVELPVEASAGEVTRRLWRAGVIERPWLFHAVVLATGAGAKAHRGTVAFRDDLSPRAVLRVLLRGTAGLIRVTIPEGWSRFEIARRLEALGVCSGRQFLAQSEDPATLARYGLGAGVADGAPRSLEGMLFPDSYDLPPDSRPEAVVDRMVSLFLRRWNSLRERHPVVLSRAAELPWSTAPSLTAGDAGVEAEGFTRGDYAALVLASMVERETGRREDRAHVASVFWNRLTDPDFRPRLLQSDPTLTYGCMARAARGETVPGCNARFGGDGGVSDGGIPSRGGGVTASMLADASNPWNTYRREALPPTPICNPGLSAMEAALNPTTDRDLYFVAGPEGRSIFATTLDQHRRNVQQFLRRPR